MAPDVKLLHDGSSSDDSAKLRLARLFVEKAARDPNNYARARELLLQVQSDTTGYVELQLGMMSQAGLGVAKNQEAAVAHYRRAALMGKKLASVLLASTWLSTSKYSKFRSAAIIFATAGKAVELGLGRRLIVLSWRVEANVRLLWRRLFFR